MRQYKKIYFIGIGGIGMSALARYFHSRGCHVSGYDRTETELTRQLVREGISVCYDDAASLAPHDVDLVIYTPAIPAEHPQLLYYQQHSFTIQKRAQVLGELTQAVNSIAVAGTHGKTTVSSMLAHLLRQTDIEIAAFLGGITTNYQTNFLDCVAEEPHIVVVEADEYDRSFLNLHPTMAVITSTDADHLDIYGTENTMQDGFCEFAYQIHEDGVLCVKYGLPLLTRLDDLKATVITYSASDSRADYFATDVVIRGTRYHFSLITPHGRIDGLELQMPGMHNVENAVAALTMALISGATPSELKSALAGFQGIKRRFEFVIEQSDKVLIDDYAHHPEEIRAFLDGVRSLYPERDITLIFQPHLYSRTRDHAQAFASALSVVDNVVLLDIYPARELPIEGISSEILLERLTCNNRLLCSKDNLVDVLRTKSLDIVLTVGAGDIADLVAPISRIMQSADGRR